MKNLLLVLLFCSIGLTSCQEEVVEMPREYIIQGNWEQYMVTEKYYDQEGQLKEVKHLAISKPLQISKDQLMWGKHKDAYSVQVLGEDATIIQNCQELPQNNKVEGATNKHLDWMAWTSLKENVPYKLGNSNEIASKVVKTIEFRRIDVSR